ncbi:methyl-accepting chemotaxis protein [Alicyclobacillus sp. SO9]|uniref:methyl-accepting chemotaxis protein n=1 Tax=Alicyclobacillus sp. SO9 TaxID=2665646 RepID=UPI001E59DDE5|nr:methyl-accepting chemotaxis protein [Alicyclobacillus sp. SO9]
MHRLKVLFQIRSLRQKLIGFSLILLIVPSLVTGLIGWRVATNQLNVQSKAALKSEVNLVNGTIKELNKEVQAGDLTLPTAQTEVKRMILGKKEANGHRPINHNYDLGKNGYFFIVNNQGVEVAHPSIEGTSIWSAKTPDGVMIGQKIVKVGQSGGGFIQYIWPLPNSKKDAKKIVYVAKDPAGWGWNVAAGSYESDYNSGANSILRYILITLGISIIAGILLTVLMAYSITKPILAVERQVRKVAGGDLTVEPLVVKNRDETSRLANGINSMTENLKNLISHITQTTQQVAASAEELSASSEESGRATEQITATIQQAADGAQTQSESVEQGKQSIVQMVQGVEQIAGTANTVSATALTAKDKTVSGNVSVQTAVRKMQDISTTVGELAGVIEQLGSKSDEIDEMLTAISNISRQTNLLALNAAIEAARAGESGRGFAVVADEVRKLAEQSAHSAEQIATLISQIHEGTTQAVSATQSTTERVSEGLDAVNTAGRSFEEIQESVQSVSSQIQSVSTAAKQLNSGTEELIKATQAVTRISEETAAGMQTVSASAEEQLAATEEITASAASLTTMAEQLQEMVNKFRV